MKAIRKVLIANRGEIALRVMRAAKARGLKTVAVYSDADANALHARSADEAVHIGPAPAAESYLVIENIIGAARTSGADAVHPGYGFLSERADFAAACEGAGLIFIAPPAAAIAAMGDKAEAKRRMIAAGVPCIPGYQDEEQSDARLIEEARRIGFPLMLKAASGGGGRGQRLVTEEATLGDDIAAARREAKSAFGDDRLILEKAIIGARHVEVQIVADAHGNIVHLGERDCSLQRRRQKVIEEAPSPVVDNALRAAMGAAAVEAARAVSYRGAGTVEFLYDPSSKEFFFLEMNTRIQVEHPVTEEVTGVDLVDLQFSIAEGGRLPFAQTDVSLQGWAMEARLYAEDPANGFLPQTGRIAALSFPQDVRVEAGVARGDEITAHYDPMIAKIIARGRTRDEAREKLAAALGETALFGVQANAAFLANLLRDQTFAAGDADIGFIERDLERLTARRKAAALDIAIAAAIFTDAPFGALMTGWRSRGAGEGAFPLVLEEDGETVTGGAEIIGDRIGGTLNGERAEIVLVEKNTEELRFRADGALQRVRYLREGDVAAFLRGGVTRQFRDRTYAPAEEAGAGADAVKSPMAGVVTSVAVSPGARVNKGDAVATVEAMKMEHRLAAPRAGVIADVKVKAGDQVAMRAVIATLEAPSNAAT